MYEREKKRELEKLLIIVENMYDKMFPYSNKSESCVNQL